MPSDTILMYYHSRINLPSYNECNPKQKLKYYNMAHLDYLARLKSIRLENRRKRNGLLRSLDPIVTEYYFPIRLDGSPTDFKQYSEQDFNRLLFHNTQGHHDIIKTKQLIPDFKYRETIFKKYLCDVTSF